jgi:hypothetical protein
MTVRPDLDRTVSSIGDLETAGDTALVQLDRGIQQKIFTRDHGAGEIYDLRFTIDDC